MLNLDNQLFVFPSLLILMSLVACLDSGGLIRGSVGVEHPHIKKCSLESATPDTTGSNIKSSVCVSVGA